ncbi:MAG: hypothetical protein ACRD8U_02775 [Pyrinomonadaceae bacterium]
MPTRGEYMHVIATPESNLAAEVVNHHLRLMGWPATQDAPLVVGQASGEDALAARAAIASGHCVIALKPEASFCAHFELSTRNARAIPPALMFAPRERSARGLERILGVLARRPRRTAKPRLRTLAEAQCFHAESGGPVLVDMHGDPVWWWLPKDVSGILLIGTDLAFDLVRYRQGDPGEVNRNNQRELWGFTGERPNYLFEPQREGEPTHARHADEWAWFLTQFLSEQTGTVLDHILPGDAPGAIVLTGDDDQANLDCYREQLELLGDMPITYLLHPQTKHTRDTLRTLLGKPSIDLGIHPDALDDPARYDERFAEQAVWYRTLVGSSPRYVRNHGYLNRAYWGHLKAWRAYGVELSSNIPGLDGTVLNGSLLPARVAADGELTEHWSILTAIGDGLVFVNEWSDTRAGECVREAAARIRASGIPGALVLNLHPENVGRTRAMHEAAIELVRDGFVAWRMSDCLNWFKARDTCASPLEGCHV